MMLCLTSNIVVLVSLIVCVCAQRGRQCDRCVPVEECPFVGSLPRAEKARFIEEFSCQNTQDLTFLFGFSPIARGDYVCCQQNNQAAHKEERPQFSHNYQPNYDSGFNRGPMQHMVRGGNGQTASYGPSPGGQCQDLTNFPPNPDTGCCGREATDSERTTGYSRRSSRNTGPPYWSSNDNYNDYGQQWPSHNSHYAQSRFPRSAENQVNITLNNRITGGSTTDFEQFPWTILLKTTFSYGRRTAAFSCGGSLISALYVLTAAHCVSDEGGQVKDVEIKLAEYDKRTFPNDCVTRYGERKCIENIVIHGDKVIPHPNYDDRLLQNDIAMIRLSRPAPYTDYIRPICLPLIDVDSTKLRNLPLAVAGWGRNGLHVSNIKQYTVVNLVPQNECQRHYPQLTRRHLCAAGYSGEDTCKGDSGGPLMMFYEGKYYVSGVVSGKRSDSPCGTSVPSLYTNVYYYMDWIQSVIRN